MVDRKKEDFMSQVEHYRAVLGDLQKQRELHELKITEIDQAISSLRRLIPEDAKTEIPTSQPQYSMSPTPVVINAGKYAGMSVRWAILNLLNEDATRPMSTGEIAEALQQGGITSTSRNFSANVSAVLSNMSNERGEVASSESGWNIAPNGRSAWAHIRIKRAEQRQQLISASVQ